MRIGKCLSTAAVALGATALAGSGAWAEVTPERANEIENGVKRWLVETFSFPNDEIALVFDGSVEVEVRDDHYHLTVPASTITVQDYFTTIVFEIGAITAELVPEGEYRFDTTWTLPTEYIIGEEDGSDQVTLTIGGQDGWGIFDTRYETFLDLGMSLDDLVLTPPDDLGHLTIASIGVFANSRDQGDEVYDFDFGMSINGTEFVDNQSGDNMLIEAFGLEGYIEELHMPEYTEFTLAMNALVTEMEQAVYDGIDPTPMIEEMADMLDNMPVMLDAMEFTYHLDGAHFDFDRQIVDFEVGALTVGIAGMAGSSGSLLLGYSQGGLTMDPSPPFAEALPENIDIALSVTDLPNEALSNALSEAFRGMIDGDPEMAMMAAVFPLLEAATQAGSTFNVDSLFLDNPNYMFDLHGFVAPSSTSPFGAILEAQLLAGRMNALVELADRLAPDPSLAAGLATLQAAGQLEDGPDGEPVRRYDFEVTEDGRMLLNGADMQPLVDEMMR